MTRFFKKIISLIGWLLIGGFAFFIGFSFWGWYFLIGFGTLAVVLFLIIWFWLAPADCFFTFVKEGTAKAVMKAEELERIIFRWRGHFMDEEDNIWEKEDWEVLPKGERKGKKGTEFEDKIVKEQKVKGIFGGLFWIGIWPFYKVHEYGLRWTDFRQTEEAGKEVFKLQFHEEKDRKFVMLKPAVYGIEVKDVETRPPERIPVTVKIPITMRVINPRMFLFIAPPTPLEDVLVRVSALMRQRISISVIDELITLQGQADAIWEGWEITEEVRKILSVQKVLGMKEEKLIKDTLRKWGLKVAEKGVEIKSIDPPSDLQKAMAEKRKQEMQAEARAEEVMGTVIFAVATADGREKADVQAEFRADPEAFYRKHQRIIDNTITKLSMEERAYLRIETPGAEGGLGDFLRFLGAWKRMPMGKLPAEEKESEMKEEKVEAKIKEKKEEKLTYAEAEVVAEAEKRGLDPKGPLEKWRQFVKEKEEKKKKRKEKWGF